MQDDRDHHTRHHVQLPSGREIEVVYLDSTGHRVGEGAQPSCTPTSPGEQLHVCPRCTGELVHPLDWAEESPGRWRISMRCPDCGLLREGVFGQALVERLDEELDKATGAILSDLKQLTHANMTEEVDLFTRALELDLIGPSDF
jgi:hypothetical protein